MGYLDCSDQAVLQSWSGMGCKDVYGKGASGSGKYDGQLVRFSSVFGSLIRKPIGSMVLLYMVTWIPSIYPQC